MFTVLFNKTRKAERDELYNNLVNETTLNTLSSVMHIIQPILQQDDAEELKKFLLKYLANGHPNYTYKQIALNIMKDALKCKADKVFHWIHTRYFLELVSKQQVDSTDIIELIKPLLERDDSIHLKSLVKDGLLNSIDANLAEMLSLVKASFESGATKISEYLIMTYWSRAKVVKKFFTSDWYHTHFHDLYSLLFPKRNTILHHIPPEVHHNMLVLAKVDLILYLRSMHLNPDQDFKAGFAAFFSKRKQGICMHLDTFYYPNGIAQNTFTTAFNSSIELVQAQWQAYVKHLTEAAESHEREHYNTQLEWISAIRAVSLQPELENIATIDDEWVNCPCIQDKSTTADADGPSESWRTNTPQTLNRPK